MLEILLYMCLMAHPVVLRKRTKRTRVRVSLSGTLGAFSEHIGALSRAMSPDGTVTGASLAENAPGRDPSVHLPQRPIPTVCLALRGSHVTVWVCKLFPLGSEAVRYRRT